MDPNANLREQEELIQELSEYRDNLGHPAAINARADLRQLRADLNSWLNSGGFEPDWRKYNRASAYYGR